MARSVSTFLMFEGVAEQAIDLYVSLFAGSQITQIERYGPNQPGKEGTVFKAHFTIAGHPLMAIDSPMKHGFSFTPSISLFVECNDEAEQQKAFDTLSAGGQVMMPLNNYGFSRRFAWVSDRYGVSWQLNLT